MRIEDKELLTITGGGLTSTFLNSLSRLITTVLDWGRTIGSSIYRHQSGNYCR